MLLAVFFAGLGFGVRFGRGGRFFRNFGQDRLRWWFRSFCGLCGGFGFGGGPFLVVFEGLGACFLPGFFPRGGGQLRFFGCLGPDLGSFLRLGNHLGFFGGQGFGLRLSFRSFLDLGFGSEDNAGGRFLRQFRL